MDPKGYHRWTCYPLTSEMARELIVVWAGRHRRDEWEALCGRYRDRIRGFAGVRDVPVKVAKGGPDKVRLDAEGRALLEALPDPCWSIALDRRAREVGSRQLADRLRGLREEWPHSVAFVVGSDLGLSREVLDACRESLSLGPLTLPHELARLVLYEQIYRALSILGGIKYHREPL
jgi:23S rRNA (pseudouridine1915-N3)-methyltransferase